MSENPSLAPSDLTSTPNATRLYYGSHPHTRITDTQGTAYDVLLQPGYPVKSIHEGIVTKADLYGCTVRTAYGLQEMFGAITPAVAVGDHVRSGATLGVMNVRGYLRIAYNSFFAGRYLSPTTKSDGSGANSAASIAFSTGASTTSPGKDTARDASQRTPVRFSPPLVGKWPIKSKATMSRTVDGITRPHDGVDYTCPSGTPVLSVGAGVVTFAGWATGYGNVVYIKHGNIQSRYAHLSAIKVKEGQKVAGAEIIGLSGNTGRSKGPHLHFELRTLPHNRQRSHELTNGWAAKWASQR